MGYMPKKIFKNTSTKKQTKQYHHHQFKNKPISKHKIRSGYAITSYQYAILILIMMMILILIIIIIIIMILKVVLKINKNTSSNREHDKKQPDPNWKPPSNSPPVIGSTAAHVDEIKKSNQWSKMQTLKKPISQWELIRWNECGYWIRWRNESCGHERKI